jgi:hypothetical protein
VSTTSGHHGQPKITELHLKKTSLVEFKVQGPH